MPRLGNAPRVAYRGDYSPTAAYAPNDLVTYQGGTYVAIKATVGNLPTVDEYWDVFAQPGAKGDTGQTGSAGPDGPKGDTGAAGPKGDSGQAGAAGAAGPKGDPGAAGAKGDPGVAGATGPGVAAGGSTGQVLTKNSNTDYDTIWSTVSSGGGSSGGLTYRYATANTTVAVGEFLVVAPGAASKTVQLPEAPAVDATLAVKKSDATASHVVVSGTVASTTIDGSTTFTLTTQGQAVMLQYNGTRWEIRHLGQRPPGTVPTGGATGASLVKTSSADFALSWISGNAQNHINSTVNGYQTSAGDFLAARGGNQAVNLPASPQTGDIVAIRNANANAVGQPQVITINPGSNPIDGVTGSITLPFPGQVVVLQWAGTSGSQGGWISRSEAGKSELRPILVSADRTAVPGEYNLVNASGGSPTVTLPGSAINGQQIAVKKADTSSNPVNVAGKIETTDSVTATVRVPGTSVTWQWSSHYGYWTQAQALVVPTGGTTGQVLAKKSGSDYDTQWVAASSGGGGSASAAGHYPGWYSGRWYTPPTSANGSTQAYNTTALLAFPMRIPNACTLSQMGFTVGTIGASLTLAFALYSDNNGNPYQLIAGSQLTGLPLNTTGPRGYSFSSPVTIAGAQDVWVVWQQSGTSSGASISSSGTSQLSTIAINGPSTSGNFPTRSYPNAGVGVADLTGYTFTALGLPSATFFFYVQ